MRNKMIAAAVSFVLAAATTSITRTVAADILAAGASADLAAGIFPA